MKKKTMTDLTDYEQQQILAFVRKFGTPDEISAKIDRLEKLLAVDVELIQMGVLARSKGVIRKHLAAFWVLVTGFVASILALLANFEKIIGLFK